jgi:hypothetical protein
MQAFHKKEVRNACLTVKANLPRIVSAAMSESANACPSCKKLDLGNGRYCIYCGSILNPIYCSHCGTMNPNDLERCLECGNPIPKLAGMPSTPIATLMNSTSTMTVSESQAPDFETEAIQPESRSTKKGLFSILRGRLKRSKKTVD